MSRPSLERVGWQPPSTFDEYRIEQLIGMGQVGSVFRAHDTLLDRPVAVKFIRALDDESLTRFLVEARAAARIQHPNVVTLFRVGQLDGRPFLVSELVEGKGLHELPTPVPREAVLEIAIGLARGLGAAHRQGVLHRDIKPGNAILTPSGEVKLLDFGLAKLAGAAGRDEHPDARIGTPYFMSPEAWQGRELGPASDLYSVGAVLHELAAGAAPFRAVPIHDLPAAVIGRDPRPLLETTPAIGVGLAAVVDRCLRRDPAERFRSAEEMLEALLRLRPAAGSLFVPEGNPYRGLQPFEAEHRGFFFGRARDVSAVIARLRAEPAVLVTGDSGAGKSSLCLAGVLPRIAQEGLGEGGPWRVVRLVPGRKPLAALANALAPVLGMDETLVEESMRISPDLVLRKLRPAGGAGIAIFVDQLEELVTLAEPAEAELAAELLSALVGRGPGVRLLACARSDFLARIAALRALGERLGRAIYLLRPLGPEDVREAIVGPARVRGGRFEPELVDALVAATGDGGLPLLQFALAELWEARERVGGTIARGSLDKIGGVAGALARHGDDVIEAMLPDRRQAARRILSRLVTAQGTRARRAEGELATDASSRAALEALVRGRLLVAREADAGGPQFELAHEALLHGWTTLSRWVAEDAGLRELRQRLSLAVSEWERAGRPGDGLWPARKLAEAAAIDRASLAPGEVEFLRASNRTAGRKRWATRLAIPAAALVAISLAAAGEVRAAAVHAAKLAAARAEARADRDAIERDLASWRQAKREAFEAFDARDRPAGEKRWAEALEVASGLESSFAHAGDRYEALALLGGGDEASGFLEEWASFEEEEGRLAVRDVLVQRMRAHDPDGVASRLWDAPATVAVSADPAPVSVELLRFEPRGKRLITVPEASGDAPFERSIAPGSYLAVFSGPGRVTVRFPFVARRGSSLRLAPRLPRPGEIPGGFVFVPEGAFLFGSAAEEGLREYYKTVPLHERTTPAFLIARDETTLGDWIQFLETLPPEEAARRTPAVSATGFHGLLRLERDHGAWSLTLQPDARAYHAIAGQRIHFDDRATRADQDWLRFPVTGISFDDAKAYAAWLDSTGRVPGARLCDEVEWERAARGADDRDYPSGGALEPDDANFDRTYGKAPLAFGPDEVGSHPGSRSPFEVDDLAGNAWEWVRSSLAPDESVARGGSYYFSSSTLRVENRELPEPTLRDPTVGMRVCASIDLSRGTP